MKLSKYDIQYKKSITKWDEALPIGNGKIGGLIYGNGPLKIAVDRIDLWDERINPVTKEKGFTFDNLVKLSLSGKQEDWDERLRLFQDIYDLPYPSKITAGRLELDFGVKESDFQSRVDLQKAVATVQSVKNNVRLETFASAVRFVGVAKIYGEFSLGIHIPDYIGESEKCGKYCLHYPTAEIQRENGFTYYVQETLSDFRYGIFTYRKNCGEYTELYYTIATNKDGADFVEKTKKELLFSAKAGYDTLFEEHALWWKNYWKKSEIHVADELIEKTYYRSWYLFASCSRKGFSPMPLQGVWTADDDKLPPWKGDYHHDTNTELSYQSYLKANRLEEGKVFVDYLWSLREKMQEFAKEFYGVEGYLLSSAAALDGSAMGGWAQYSYDPTMTIWLAQSFDEYWLYTDDYEFLKTRAYPFFKGVYTAIKGLLREKDGKLYLPISVSPELYNAAREAYVEPNSNFNLALMIYMLQTLQKYSEILGLDGSEYAEMLTKLDPIAINQDGVVMVDKKHCLPFSHRHFSHTMCLYPLHLINYDTPENIRVYEETILQLEQLGKGWWVGFGFAMMAQLYAMAYKGNAAYETLRQFCKGFVAENGFHLNGDFKHYGFSQFHYRPFTLESSFGFCDALQEMLLQEHKGYIEIFPAVPEGWEKEVSFQDLRSYHGVLVSAKKKNGKVVSVQLKAKKETKVVLKKPFLGNQVEMNGKMVFASTFMELTLPKGKTIIKGV